MCENVKSALGTKKPRGMKAVCDRQVLNRKLEVKVKCGHTLNSHCNFVFSFQNPFDGFLFKCFGP